MQTSFNKVYCQIEKWKMVKKCLYNFVDKHIWEGADRNIWFYLYWVYYFVNWNDDQVALFSKLNQDSSQNTSLWNVHNIEAPKCLIYIM